MRTPAIVVLIAYLSCTLPSFGQFTTERDTIEILDLFEKILNAQGANLGAQSSRPEPAAVVPEPEVGDPLDYLKEEDDLDDLLGRYCND